MSKRLIVRTRCPICGDQVEPVPDGILRREPHYNNAEMVVTRTGYKQYIHTSCWYGMIEEQKKRCRLDGSNETGSEQKKRTRKGAEQHA